jgi:hypothetical protein
MSPILDSESDGEFGGELCVTICDNFLGEAMEFPNVVLEEMSSSFC